MGIHIITTLSFLAFVKAFPQKNLLSKKTIKNQENLQQIAQNQLAQASSEAQQVANQGLITAQDLADKYKLKDFDGNPIDIKELQKLASKSDKNPLPSMEDIQNKVEQLVENAQKVVEENRENINKMKKQNLREVYDEAFRKSYDGFDHADPLIERDLKKIMQKVYLKAIKLSENSSKDPLSQSQPDLGKIISLVEREANKQLTPLIRELRRNPNFVGDVVNNYGPDVADFFKNNIMG